VSFDPSGQFRRSGQRDDRRRRLLVEEGLAGDASVSTASAVSVRSPTVRRSRHYGDAEFLGTARRVIDLVPRGWGAWVLTAALGLAMIVLLELAYAKLPPELVHSTGTFDLLAPGSLARWTGSLVLLAGAAVSVLIYAIRRHRTDDYRGRYRRWLSVAFVCAVLAADEAAGLFPTVLTAVEYFSGSDWLRAHWLALVGGVALTGLLLCFRPLWELRECPTALALAIVSALALTAAVVFRAIPWEQAAAEEHAMICKGSDLAGYVLALFALGLFARYCLLDAEGGYDASEEAEPSPRVDKSVPSADNQPRNIVRIDPAAGIPPADQPENEAGNAGRAASPESRRSLWRRLTGMFGRNREKPVSESNEPAESAADASRRTREPHPRHDSEPAEIRSEERSARAASSSAQRSGEPTESKLSKAERKALKQQLMRERIARQQQQQANWR